MSKAKFNWITTLRELGNGRPLKEKEYSSLLDKAGNWPTCACGQLCKSLERDSEGCPKDNILESLGMSFYYKIEREEWCKALSIFYEIEARTAHLLKERRKRYADNAD